MSVGPLQGDSWVFGYYGGLFRGLIRGLTGSLYYFSDSNGTVILLRIIVVIYCSFLNRFDKLFE